jgi:RNA polymerase sigma-70 factor (ECF subfamily)
VPAAAPLDDAVVDACRRGDRAAFARLYEARKDRVHSLAWYMTGDRAAAEDIAQQVFLKLFDAFATFRHEAHVDTWLYQVTLNACRDHRRRTGRVWLVPLELARALVAPTADPETSSARQEIGDAVRDVVRRLSPKLRTVIMLKYVAELSYAEIAQTLGCSIGTVGSRLNRAHEILARDLQHVSTGS